MAEGTEITPTIHGLPYPVVVREPHAPNSRRKVSFDHHFHPESDPQLQGVDGLALRHCRGQFLEDWLHRRKHEVYKGPNLVKSAADKFDIVLRACTGDIPRFGIYFDDRGDPHEVALTDAMIAFFRVTGNIHVEDSYSTPSQQRYVRNRIGMFLASYCASQDLNLNANTADEFINTTVEGRKKELGNQFLSEAIQASISPVEALRSELLEKGLFIPAGPVKPLYTTVKDFFVKERFDEYHRALELNLGGQALQTEVNGLELVSH